MMYRYLLFAGKRYYPRGGGDDFIKAFQTLEEAKQAEFNAEWAEIWEFDPTTGILEKVVEEFRELDNKKWVWSGWTPAS